MQKLSPSADISADRSGIIDLDAILPRNGLVKRELVRSLLGIAVATEQRWIARGDLPTPRLAGRFYDAGELRQALIPSSAATAEVA